MTGTKQKPVERAERTVKKSDDKRTSRVSREKRVAYSGSSSRLEVPQKIKDLYPPDNRWRWVNDEEGEVGRREQAGWIIALDENEEPISRPVGRGKTKDAINAYLMTVSYEFYKEDFEAQQQFNNRFQDSLKKGVDRVENVSGTSGGTYAPNLDNGAKGYSESQGDRMIK